MYTAFWKSKLAEVTASTSKLLKIPVEAYYKRSLCSIRMTKKYCPVRFRAIKVVNTWTCKVTPTCLRDFLRANRGCNKLIENNGTCKYVT
jgi:hypothetical protein